MTGDAREQEFLSGLKDRMWKDARVRTNSDIDVIVVLEDRIRRTYGDHVRRLADEGVWLSYLGLGLAILLTLASAEFRDLWKLDAGTIRGAFLCIMVASFVKGTLHFLKWRKRPGEDDFIQVLRAESVAMTPAAAQVVAPPAPALQGSSPGTAAPVVQTVTPEPIQSESFGEVTVSVREKEFPWWQTGGTTVQHTRQINFPFLLVSSSWVLIFNPPAKAKAISFNADGSVGEGQNNNEHSWRLIDDRLELIQADGKVHSRFRWVSHRDRWVHTNEPDLLSIKKQEIRRVPSMRGQLPASTAD